MRLLAGVMLLMLASGAAAEPLRFFKLGFSTTRAAMANLLGNCQESQTTRGQTVCVLNRGDLGGVPLGTSLAQFQHDQLQFVSMVAFGRFQDVSRVLEDRYGRPARSGSNQVRQTDGRLATLRSAEWNFDDGGVQLVAADIRGDRPSALIRFTWRRPNS